MRFAVYVVNNRVTRYIVDATDEKEAREIVEDESGESGLAVPVDCYSDWHVNSVELLREADQC